MELCTDERLDGLELLGEAGDPVDADGRGPLDEELLSRLDRISLCANGDALEEPPDQLGGIDADRARGQCRSEMRVLRRERLSAE